MKHVNVFSPYRRNLMFQVSEMDGALKIYVANVGSSSTSDILFRWTGTYTTGSAHEQKGSRNIEMSNGTRKRQGGRF